MTDGLATGTLESAATLDRVRAALYARQVTMSPAIDHGAGALQAGMVQRSTVLIVFGNPRGDTRNAGRAARRDRSAAPAAGLGGSGRRGAVDLWRSRRSDGGSHDRAVAIGAARGRTGHLMAFAPFVDSRCKLQIRGLFDQSQATGRRIGQRALRIHCGKGEKGSTIP
jgi:hypothetical protein